MGQAVWIEGRSRSGKTTQLCQQFGEWLRSRVHPSENVPLGNSVLVLAANSQTRHHLQQALTNIIAPIATQRNTAFWLECKTPLGFFREAVLLYWPLLVAGALSPVLLPTQIRPEMEQYLALRQWQAFFPTLAADLNDHQQARYVRNLLDVQQLAAAAGLTEAALAERWEAGQFATAEMTITTEALITFTRHWRHWCWQRGLLTYGLIFECYRQHLLPNPTYQQALRQHYDALFADDVDDYPAIAADLFEQLQPQLGWSVMTFNPHGQVRLGINADPEVLKRLSSWTISPEGGKKTPPPLPGLELAPGLGQQMLEILADPTVPLLLPPSVQTLQTENRAQLLREVSQIIITAVQQQQIPPQEIAVIAPGLDDVARYSLLEILQGAGINTAVLNEQWASVARP